MSDNLQKLYESTRRMNPNFTVPFDEFSKDMQDVGNRQRFYNNTRKNNPEFTVSFDEFSKDIGFGNSIDWGGPQFRPTSQPLPEKQKQAPVKVQAGGAGKPEIKDMMFPPLTGYDKPITMKSPTAPKTTVSIGNDAAEGLVQPFGKGKPLAVTAGEQVAGIQLPPDRKLNAQLMGWLDSQGKTIDDYKDTNAPDNFGGNPLAKAWLEANKVETGEGGSGYYGYGGMAVGNRKPERVNTPAQYAALQDFFTKSPTGRELSAKLEEKRKSLDDEVRALLPQTQKMQEEISRRGRQNIVSNPSSIPIIRPELDKQNAKDIIMQRAISFVNEAGKRISATKEGGGFLKGIGHDWGDALRLLAPGIDMVQDETINNLVDKYQKNPKSLTADEKFILNAKRLSDEVASYYDAGSWYNIGQSTKQSLPFMRDFIFTEGIGSGISNAVKSGIERTLTRSGVTGLASRIFNPATVNRAETVGKGIIDLTVQPTVQTALGLSSYGMTAQSMSGQGSTDAEGNMQFDNRDSLGSSLLGTWVQNHSELFGTVVLDKLFSKFKLLPKFLDTPRAQSIARVTGIASPLGEYGEEKESDAIDVLRGKQTAEEFFDPRRNAETFGAVAVMQVPFTAIQSAGYAVGKYGDKARAKAISGSVGEAEKSLDIFGNEKQGIISYIDNALNDENPMTLNASLASMMQRADLTDEQKQAVKDYAVARSAKQGIDDFAAGKPERKGADEILGNIVDPPIPEGVDPDDPDTHAGARVQLDEAARQAQALLSGEDLDILSEMSLIPADKQRASIQDMFRDKNLSDEQKQAVVNYLSMANQSRKLEEAHRSNVIGRLQQAENEITASVNPTTGTIVTARVQGMEQPVRIKEGLAVRVNPENAENPFETDVENSLETVSYYGEDGKVYPALAENLEVLSNDGVEQQLEALRQRFAAEEEAFQLAVNGPQPAVNFQQFQAGDKGMLPDGSVTAIQDVRPDGTYVVQVENRQTGEINVAEVPAGEIGNYGFGEVVDAPAEVQPSDEAQATPQPSTEVSEEKPVFPVNKEGEIDYGQISNPKMYLDALTLEFGEDVPEIVAEKRKEAVAELEQAGKKKDIIARKRAEKKAQEQVAFWDNVEGLYSQEESQGLENNVVRENNSQTKSQDLQNDTQAELPDLNPTSENLPENTGLPDATQGNAVTGSSFSANPVIERYPRLVEPEKPLSEMTSEELLQLSDKNLRALKAQDRAFEGKTEAEKESGGYYGVLDDVSDLRDTAMQVNFVENSESLDELAGSAKSTLQEMRGTPNEYQQAVLSAVGRKAGEMGVSLQDLVRAMAEKVASQYPDLNDAEFMVRSMLGKVMPENDSQKESQGLQNNLQTESQGNDTPEITGVGIDRQIEEQQPNTDPTEAQKAAGNYKKAHVQVNRMDISIENPVGSVRSGTDEDGKAWEHKMKSHYGYFTRTTGKDGDHIDVFVKEGTPEDWNGTVFVVDQVNPSTGEFDESKVMLGYETLEEAKAAYMENYDADWQGFGAITPVDVDSFKKWLYDGARQRKAFAEYVGTPSAVSSDQLAVSSGKMPEGVEKIQPVELGEQERLRTELQNSKDRNEVTPELEKLIDRLKQTGLAKDVVMDEGKMREYLDRHFGGLLKPRMQVEKPKSPKKENGSATLKEKQLATVIKYNPAPNSYNTWIRDVSDILFAEEAFGVAFADGAMYPDFSTDDMRSALEKGEMTVYSSKPIRKGSFVTPSQMNAESYAGGGKIYSKVIKLTDVAWIDEGEGQYAPVRMMSTPAGEVYGFATADGTIYLDPNRMNANTPIHEFGHLLWNITPEKRRGEITKLLKQTPGWSELENNPAYYNLKTDDQKADELFNTILGNSGKSNNQVRDIMGHDIGLFARVMDAVNKLLEWVKANVFGNTDARVNQFAKRSLGELLGGKNLTETGSSSRKNEDDSNNLKNERYRIIGEIGASRISDTETVVNDLNVAKEMYSQNKDAKSIRLATGWEKGVDGLWRYEVPDFKMRDVVLQKNKNDQIVTSLTDIIDDEELFKAYPILKETVVSEDYGGTSGFYSAVTNIIGLNSNKFSPVKDNSNQTKIEKLQDRMRQLQDHKDVEVYQQMIDNYNGNDQEIEKYLDEHPVVREYEALEDNVSKLYGDRKVQGYRISDKSTLLHEIQHVIQRIEGFARGANEKQFTDPSPLSLAYKDFDLNVKLLDGDKYENIGHILNDERFSGYRSVFASDINEGKLLINGLRDMYSDMNKETFMDNYEYYVDSGKKGSPYEQYFKTAGEVESRNVQSRMDMTPEERRSILLSETADVAPEDQIVLMNQMDRANYEINAQDYDLELEKIKKRSISDGTFMKAPNGKPTNLNERQWLQVRTDAFKKWFGDWQEDPGNASKVVDENGEPMVVYHGTNAEFSEFKDLITEGLRTTIANGYGFFFTPSLSISEKYGQNTMPVFLNMRNWKEIQKGKQFSLDKKFIGADELLRKESRQNTQESGFDGFYMPNISFAKKRYSTTENIPQYVVFSPTQIKSATGNQGTFDGGNADIRMQAKKDWQQEESDKQFEKAKTVLDAFKKEGLDGFSISRSITDFGVSTYIQGPYNLKFRISDHSVLSTHRILNESFFYYNTPVEFLVNEAKVAKEKYEKIYASREEAEKKYRKREQESADKWERIKSNFDGLVFKKNNRTYQNFDVFSKAGQNPRSNIYQKSLEGGAFYYEWTEPTDYDKWGNPFNFGEKKPSMEYIEAFDEGAGEINTTRFQIAPSSKPEYTPVKSLGDYAREVDEYNQNIRMQAVPPQENEDEQELRRLNNSLKYGVENKLSDLEQALANKEVSEASYRKQRDELELMAEKIRAKIKDAEKLRDMVKMREDYQAEMRRIKAMEIEKEGREKLTEEDMPYVNDAEELKRVQQIVSDVENLAGVENTEELAVDPKDLVAVVRSIKNKKKQQENLPKIKKAAQDITDYVRAYVGKDVVDMMSERDFKALINKLETATSTGSLKSAVKSVNQAIMRIILRKNNDILSGLIHGKIVNTYAIYELDSTLKANNDLTEGNKEKIDKDIFHLLSGINAYNRYFEIQGKNKRGVSVAKNVDEGTREIIQFVRDNRKVSREKLGEMKKEIELAQTSENYVFDEGDGRRLVAIDLLGKLQDLQDKDADIKAIQETSPADFNQENPDKWKWEAVMEGQKELEAMQMELITEFTDLIELGRSRMTEWKAAETERKNEIAGEAIAAVKDKRIKTQAEEKNTNNWERVKDVVRHNGIKEFLLSPLGSFNFMLKYIDRNNVVGEGPMYNRFMRSPENSVTAAKEKYYTGWDSFKRESAAKAEEIFGKKFKDVVADSRKDSGVEVSYKLFDKNGENGELVPVMAAAQMTKGELMYLYMTWQQVEGREKLENMLVDETVMESVKQTLGEKYIRYADWVQQEFLPSRRVEYNDTHKRVFGTSMAEVKNYFPLKYDEKQHVEEVEIGQEVNYGLPSTMTGAIINRVKNKKDIALNANAFDLLMKNGQEMEEWSAYAQLRKDMNALLSNNYFKNLVEASDRTAFKKLKESAQIALRAVRQKAMPEETLAGNINRRLAGGAIAFRINTALKQFLGYPAFMSYSLDPMYQARVANNILPYMYYRNYVWAVENLPGFKERVSSGVFGNEKLLAGEWATSEQVKGKRKVLGKYGVQMDDFFNSLISVGMKPNQWVDAVAVSAGAKAVYDYKKGLYKKQGIDEREAHERAIFDASIAANETQQSAEDAYLSPIQKSDTLFARGLTTFMNASFGFLRKHVEGMMQVARSKKQYDNLVAQKTGSGMSEEKAKSEALKTVLDADGRAVLNILVFGFMLNTIWDLADKALWGTGDDDDEEQAEMYKSLALSPVKNMLLGSTIVSTLEGYEPKDLMGGEITRAYNELSKIAKDEGYLNSEMALATSKYFMKFYTGINFDVWNNIYNGYERGIKEKGGATMAYQYFTNVPQSVRIATAKKIRPGESIGDYAKRVSLAYEKESMFDREMKAVLTKYMFSDEEGKMTLFNKAYDKAREWEKIKKDEAKKNTGKWKELAGLDSDNSLTMLYKLVDNGMGQYKKAVKNGIDFSDEDKKTAMETYRKNVLALVEKINGKK
jgi:hypothetical protein